MAVKFWSENQTASGTSEWIKFSTNGNQSVRIVQLLGTSIGGGTVEVQVAPVIEKAVSSADAKTVHVFNAITDEPKVVNAAIDYAIRLSVIGSTSPDINGSLSSG